MRALGVLLAVLSSAGLVASIRGTLRAKRPVDLALSAAAALAVLGLLFGLALIVKPGFLSGD